MNTTIHVHEISRAWENGTGVFRTARKCDHEFSCCENLYTQKRCYEFSVAYPWNEQYPNFGLRRWFKVHKWGGFVLLATQAIQNAKLRRNRAFGYICDTKCRNGENSSFWLCKWYKMQEWRGFEILAKHFERKTQLVKNIDSEKHP